MATLSTTARNAATDGIVDQVDVGGGTATLVFQNSSDSTLATINLPNPAFGASSTGAASLLGVPLSTTVSSAGTASKAKLVTRGAVDLVTAITVGTSGSEINFSSVTWGSGDTIQITSLTATTPA